MTTFLDVNRHQRTVCFAGIVRSLVLEAGGSPGAEHIADVPTCR